MWLGFGGVALFVADRRYLCCWLAPRLLLGFEVLKDDQTLNPL